VQRVTVADSAMTYQGKTFTTFFMSLMLRVDEAAGDGDRLTDDERQRIRKQIRHQMKSTFLPQDRASLSKLEDKYIFRIDEMKQVGRDAGFAEVTFMNDPRGFGYWAYVAHTCQIVGVAPARIQRYEWIEDEFREEILRLHINAVRDLIKPNEQMILERVRKGSS
jgi:hypothetical protein